MFLVVIVVVDMFVYRCCPYGDKMVVFKKFYCYCASCSVVLYLRECALLIYFLLGVCH